MMEIRTTVREVLCLLWKADSYPCIGNEDWPVAKRMEAAAIEKATTAVVSPDESRLRPRSRVVRCRFLMEGASLAR
jgi:hypothetical protein